MSPLFFCFKQNHKRIQMIKNRNILDLMLFLIPLFLQQAQVEGIWFSPHFFFLLLNLSLQARVDGEPETNAK